MREDSAIARIILAYSSADRAPARRISQQLSALGHTIVVTRDAPPGQSWAEFFHNEILAADALIALWSPTAGRRPHVLTQARIARQKDKLVDVRVEPGDLPVDIPLHDVADLSVWNGDLRDPDWRAILSSIEALARGERRTPAEPVAPPVPEPAPPTAAAAAPDAASFAHASTMAPVQAPPSPPPPAPSLPHERARAARPIAPPDLQLRSRRKRMPRPADDASHGLQVASPGLRDVHRRPVPPPPPLLDVDAPQDREATPPVPPRTMSPFDTPATERTPDRAPPPITDAPHNDAPHNDAPVSNGLAPARAFRPEGEPMRAPAAEPTPAERSRAPFASDIAAVAQPPAAPDTSAATGPAAASDPNEADHDGHHVFSPGWDREREATPPPAMDAATPANARLPDDDVLTRPGVAAPARATTNRATADRDGDARGETPAAPAAFDDPGMDPLREEIGAYEPLSMPGEDAPRAPHSMAVLSLAALTVVTLAGSLGYLGWSVYNDTSSPASAEADAWASAQDRDTREAYTAFLRVYGDSAYAAEARERRAALSETDRTPSAAPVRAASARTALRAAPTQPANALASLTPELARALAHRATPIAATRRVLNTATPTANAEPQNAGQALMISLREAAHGRMENAGVAWSTYTLLGDTERRRQDDIAFNNARLAGTPEAYAAYLRAFPQGVHAAEARAATNPFNPFGLEGLPADIAQAVTRARTAAGAADQAAQGALIAAQRAQTAAARARASTPGHVVRFYTPEERYDGAYAEGRPEGFGVYTISVNGGESHYYSGGFEAGARHGLGVYAIAQAGAEGASVPAYAGEWRSGAITGRGVMNLGSGATIAGEFVNGVAEGHGVATSADGRYEGGWLNDAAHGYGVFWDSEGRAQLVGVWENHVLIQPM